MKLSKLQRACKVYVKAKVSLDNGADDSTINEGQVKEMLSKLQTSRRQNGNNDDSATYYFSKVIAAENQEFYLLQLGDGITTATIIKTAKTCDIAPYHLFALARKNTNLNDNEWNQINMTA